MAWLIPPMTGRYPPQRRSSRPGRPRQQYSTPMVAGVAQCDDHREFLGIRAHHSESIGSKPAHCYQVRRKTHCPSSPSALISTLRVEPRLTHYAP